MNFIKTMLLLTVMMGIFLLVGYVIGGNTRMGATNGMLIGFLIAFAINFITYWFSSKIVLAMYSAREVTEAEQPDLYNITSQLVTQAGIPMPKLYIINQAQPNAFATGRNPKNSVVAVTSGILNLLDRDELAGVIAHELSHIKHRDILLSTIVATMAGAISIMTRLAFFGRRSRGNPIIMLIAMIAAPLAAIMIQMAISRTREYKADAGSAAITGNPQYLANALNKLHNASQKVELPANPATSHMFIVNPLSAGGLRRLFSTHPPMEKRIEKLLGR